MEQETALPKQKEDSVCEIPRKATFQKSSKFVEITVGKVLFSLEFNQAAEVKIGLRRSWRDKQGLPAFMWQVISGRR